MPVIKSVFCHKNAKLSTTQDPKRIFFSYFKKTPQAARTPIGTIRHESHELISREKEHEWNWSISTYEIFMIKRSISFEVTCS